VSNPNVIPKEIPILDQSSITYHVATKMTGLDIDIGENIDYFESTIK